MLAQYVRIDDLHIRGALQKKKNIHPFMMPGSLRGDCPNDCMHNIQEIRRRGIFMAPARLTVLHLNSREDLGESDVRKTIWISFNVKTRNQ